MRLLMCRGALLAAALTAASCATTPVHGQGLRVTQPAPDCNLAARAFDNPFSDSRGWVQPRMAWHAEYALASYGVAAMINRLTGLSPWATAAIAAGVIGVLPHARSVLFQRRYPLNPGDVLFDAVNRGTPFVWASGRLGHRDDSTRSWVANHWRPAAAWLVFDLSLACFASP